MYISMFLPLILDYKYFTRGRDVETGIRIDGEVVNPDLSQDHRWLRMKIISPAHITLMLCLFIRGRRKTLSVHGEDISRVVAVIDFRCIAG